MRVVPLFKKKNKTHAKAPSILPPHISTWGEEPSMNQERGPLAGPEYTDTLLLDSQALKP